MVAVCPFCVLDRGRINRKKDDEEGEQSQGGETMARNAAN